MLNNDFMKSDITWSVMIPTYNCAKYLTKTLNSVLEQDLGEDFMQIEVIDDCSSDDVVDIVKQIGGGRVSFFKHEKNVGHVKNFETAINRAKGKYIHLLHGDDFVLPGFYISMTRMYENHNNIGACYCRHFFVDEENNIIKISELSELKNVVILDFHKTLIHRQKIQTPSITVKKETYNKLGSFNPTLSWTEDWEMWVRICSKYPIGYIKEPLACYRMHSGSSSRIKSVTGENVNDLLRIQNIFNKYTSNKKEKDELRNSFKKLIYEISYGNYISAKLIRHPEFYRHLLTMAKNTDSFILKTHFILNYLIKKWI